MASGADVTAVIIQLFILAMSFLWFPQLIRLALRFNLVDTPSTRRKHAKPIPIVGGLGILSCWFVGMLCYSLLSPAWFHAHTQSILVFSVALLAINGVGLIDDFYGLSPKIKLMVQFATAFFILFCEPQIHQTCVNIAASLPTPLNFGVWILASIWIVGTSNAVNLIDGIDGFAGGVSLLAMVTILILHSVSGGSNGFMPVAVAMIIPGLVQFLRHNWNPAKIFLGDNGSLTLGFFIAVSSLIPSEPEHAIVTIGSLLIMMAFPILDMGLCVARRLRKGYPIFKADRSHLHHRVQRLGLNVTQTTTLLLCIVGYFQVSSVLVHMVHWRLALLVSASAALGLITLLYLIRCTEAWRSNNLLNKSIDKNNELYFGQLDQDQLQSMIRIDLSPLLEVGQWEEKNEAESILASIFMLMRRSIRSTDSLSIKGNELCIFIGGGEKALAHSSLIEKRIYTKLSSFQQMFRLQYSLDGLPIQKEEAKKIIGAA